MQKRWNKAETDYLKRHSDRSLEELADHFRTDPETVKKKLESIEAGDTKVAPAVDTSVEDYGKALEWLHEHKWDKAAALFEQVIAEADSQHLADRARQNLAICSQYLREKDPDQDPYLQAVVEKNQGRFEEALALCKKHGQPDKDERYAYLVASILALAGDEEDALEHLQAAIRLEPKNRVHAYHDPDFKDLQGSDEFRQITMGSSS